MGDQVLDQSGAFGNAVAVARSVAGHGCIDPGWTVGTNGEGVRSSTHGLRHRVPFMRGAEACAVSVMCCCC